jgi:hypothetical protein
MARYKTVDAAGALADKQLEPLKKALRVKPADVDPLPTEVLEGEIVALAEGVRKLREGRLNDKALLLLIQHATPSHNRVTQGQIQSVLDAISNLDRIYLK